MSKINYKSVLIPTSKSFTQVEGEISKEEFDEGEGFNPGDNGKAEDQMFSVIQADALLLNILLQFPDRQKIIFLYQVLREAGYNLNHEDCAKTLSITREHYMFLLADVRKKAKKILQTEGY